MTSDIFFLFLHSNQEFSNSKTLQFIIIFFYFTEATQISLGCSTKAQLDLSQGRGINHSPRAGAVAGPETHPPA